jgi:serine protease Do
VERGWLGVSIQEITPALSQSLGLPDGKGALVAQVTEGSPAATAGLKRGDVIVAVGDRAVNRATDLPPIVADLEPGRPTRLTVLREGKRISLDATITRLDEEREPRAVSKAEPQGRLGLVVGPLTPEVARELSLPRDSKGVVIRDVRNGSPADEAGLRPADVIMEVNRRPVESVEDLRRMLDRQDRSAPLLLLIRRESAERYVTIT